MSPTPRILLTGVFAAGTVLAQQPAVPPPGGIPAVPAPPVAAPGIPAAGGNQAGLPLSERVKQEGFIQPKINGEALAVLYTELTGRRVTVSNAAIAAEFRFVQPGPITYGEAAELLKIAAVMEGFVFVPSGNNHDKLVVSPNAAANPKALGLRVFSDADELPEGDQVVTYVMQLQHIKPEEVVRTFTAVIGQFGAFGSIAAVPNASAVVITENTSLIRTLIELQKTIDVPAGKVSTKFIKVQYADVTELSETLNQLVGAQQQQKQTSAAVQRVQQNIPQGLPPGVPNPGGPGIGGESSAGEDIAIQIVPASRTNEIFIMGRPVDITFVESLVRGFDSPTDQKNFLRRKLKFVSVADFLPVAQQAIERAFGAASTTGGAAGAAGGGNRGASGANFGGGGGGGGNRTQTGGGGRSSTSGFGTSASSGFGSNASSGFGGGGSTGAGGSSSGGLSNTQVDTAPEALLVGRTLLVADKITNSIVAQGPPASLEIINGLLDEIDVKAEQVMISCVFGQLRLDNEFNMGIDYLRTLDQSGSGSTAGRGGAGTGGIIPLTPGTAFAPGTLGAAAGLNVYGKIGEHFNVYLNALQTSENFTVLSRPTIFTANNQKGSITSGTQIAVPSSSYTSTAGTANTNFDFRDVALTLEVIPLVNSKDEVTLQIFLVSQDLGNLRTIGEYEINDIINRQLVTTVTVPNNETIVLGGLITTREDKSKSGIPVLSQIPYIGALFGKTSTTKNRDELLIFIQPKIVMDGANLYEAQNDMNGRYQVDDKGRAFLDGPGGGAPDPAAVQQPIVESKGSRSAAAPLVPAAESGTPRRTGKPKTGFSKSR